MPDFYQWGWDGAEVSKDTYEILRDDAFDFEAATEMDYIQMIDGLVDAVVNW